MSSYKHDCKGPFDSCKLSVKDFFYNFACDGEKKTVHGQNFHYILLYCFYESLIVIIKSLQCSYYDFFIDISKKSNHVDVT